MKLRLLLVLLLGLAGAPNGAAAMQVIVPDQYATIQAALNAVSDYDTVCIRDGDYPEVLTIPGHVSLVTLPTSYGGPGSPFLGVARVRSATGSPHVMRGLRFSEHVMLTGSGVSVENCRFDAGLECPGLDGHVWSCIVIGDLDLGYSMTEVAMTTVLDGGITGNPPGSESIKDCVVIGSGTTPTGIYCYSDLGAERNLVRNCVTGIYSSFEFSPASDNVIEDCSGAGLLAARSSSGAPIEGNTIRRCGRGIDITFQQYANPTSSGLVSDNLIEDVGAEGIRATGSYGGGAVVGNTIRNAGGQGIDAGSSCETVKDNVVLESGAEGVVLSPTFPGVVTGNVVAGSNGRGIVASNAALVRNNTTYLNDGHGFDLTGSAADSVDHNIAYGNGGTGLNWSGAAPVIGCNDWFENTAGATAGVSPGASDVMLDPLFCNLNTYDAHLQPGSPLASLTGCGLVGALGVGCLTTAVSPASTAVEHLALAAMPVPSAAEVRLAWSSPAVGGRLEVFDVGGQRRWSRTLDGTQGEIVWTGVSNEGQPVPPGVYFARLIAAGHALTRRVVLAP